MKDLKLTFTSLIDCKQKLNDLFIGDPSAKFRLTISKWGKKRSLKANAAYYAWLPDISDFTCTNLREARNVLKLDFGIPIVLADNDIGQRYGDRLDKINFFNLTREELIGHFDNDGKWQNGIMEIIQVTSLMNTSQHNQMRDNILYFYNQAGLNIGYND